MAKVIINRSYDEANRSAGVQGITLGWQELGSLMREQTGWMLIAYFTKHSRETHADIIVQRLKEYICISPDVSVLSI